LNKFYQKLNKNFFSKNKTFVIAEIGTNHNQKLSQAKKLIKIAKSSGADAVKFQLLNFQEQYNEKSYNNNFKNFFQKIEFNNDWLNLLIKFCKEQKIFFFASPTYFKAAEILLKKTKVIKIASPQFATDDLLTEKIIRGKKTCIVSNGLLSLQQTIKKINYYRRFNKSIILLHCISRYPTKINELNLNCIKFLKKKLNLPIGFSDHTTSIDIPSIAVALGAQVIEKHITLNRNLIGPDHKFALEPYEFKKMVKKIRETENSLGKSQKLLNYSDKKILRAYRPKIFSKINISKNKFLKDNLLYTKRSKKGINYSKDLNKFQTNKKILANKIILKKDLKI